MCVREKIVSESECVLQREGVLERECVGKERLLREKDRYGDEV